MGLLQFITHYISQHVVLSYTLLLASVVIEGEIAIIFLGVFASTKIIPIQWALMIAAAGATVKTFLGYCIGALIKKYIPQNKIFDFIERRVLLVFPHFRERPFWSLFFSKFIYGLNHFTIIFSGYIGSRWRTYLMAEVVSSLAWITIMFSIGFFFTQTAFEFSNDIRKVAIYVLVGIIGFLLIERLISFIIEFIESD